MSFHLFSSNKLEVLGENFCRQVYLRQDRADLFAPCCAVVRTQGMAAWLKLYLGEHAIIAANLATPFLDNFVSGVLRRVYGQMFDADGEYFSQNAMQWRIFRKFCENTAEYPELAPYFSGREKNELKRWQLACRVADMFDQYQIVRAVEMGEWEKESFRLEKFDFQRRLYLDIANNRHGKDWYLRQFIAGKIPGGTVWPENVSVFGIGAMPPVYLDFFFKLSELCDVNFFYLNPCREYWGDLYSRREIRKMLNADELPPDGNPLLAAFGTQGREFFYRLCDPPESSCPDGVELYEDFTAGRSTMLGCVQQDILDMIDRSGGGAEAAADETIQIHNTHSMRRELEVLHDNILHVLTVMPDLELRDIIVMAPDINIYAPYINAVFGGGALAGQYTVADRNVGSGSVIADTFSKILHLPSGRFSCSEIFEILTPGAVHEKFGMQESDLGTLRKWCNKAGVRWGIDARDRERICGVEFDEYSWRQGLDRMLQGMAVIPEIGDAVPGVECGEGNDAVLLGNFIAFVEQLSAVCENLRYKRDADGWVTFLRQLLADFFADSEEFIEELSLIRGELGKIGIYGNKAGFTGEFDRDIVCDITGNLLNSVPGAFVPFLRGKITFCSLIPMRSVPCRVVAIMGLNDGSFPRREIMPGFNLLSFDRKRGDRSRQAEDRYLFLEALLSARDLLLLSYQGQTDRGDDEYPPSTVLGELAAYLEKCFNFKETRHKLQAFDAAYFTVGGELHSCSANNYRAARSLLAELRNTEWHESEERGGGRLCLPGAAAAETPSLDELTGMFSHPARYFLQVNCGMSFWKTDHQLTEDDEPFGLDALAAYVLTNDIARWTLAELPPDVQYSFLLKSGRLPLGIGGRREFDRMHEMVSLIPVHWRERILRQSKFSVSAMPYGNADTDKCVSGVIAGDGKSVYTWRMGSCNLRMAVSLRLGHLAANCAAGGVPGYCMYIKDKHVIGRELPPLAADEARAALRTFIELYYEGMRSPLAIFPDATRAFGDYAGDVAKKIEAAEKAFSQNYLRAADADDPAIRRFFTASDFADADFLERFIMAGKLIYDQFSQEKEGADE